MDDQFQKALNEGAAKQIQFMTKNLNVWTTTSSVWISNSYIESTRLKINDDILYNKKCFVLKHMLNYILQSYGAQYGCSKKHCIHVQFYGSNNPQNQVPKKQ